MSGPEPLSREDLLAVNALLHQQIDGLTAANALLRETVERQAEQIARLERRLGRHSGNSNLPPSSDVFSKPAKPAAVKSSRRRGRQPGAPGSGLALVDTPDEVVDLFPASCGGCGGAFAALGAGDSLGYVRRQCRDVPAVSVTVTETRWHTVACGCGAASSAPVPAHVPDAPCYGPNLQSLAVYLVVYQHVPVRRAAELIADLTGASVSEGWISAVLPKAAALVAPALKLIRALLVLGHVVHADETTTRIGARRAWLHTACTDKLTLLALAPRSREGARSLGVLGAFRGTLVHDALALYDGFGDARHQLCVAHVIRELTDLHEQYPEQMWADQARWALARLIEQARRAREAGLTHIPPEQGALYLRLFHQGIAVGLSLHPRVPGRAQSQATNLLERLRDRAGEYLRFVDDLHIPATNNQAERDLRPVKTQCRLA